MRPIQFGPVLDDLDLFADDGLQRIWLPLHSSPKLLIDKDVTILRHRTHGQFRLGWVGEFPQKDNVHRRPQGLGHFLGHHDPTPGKTKDQDFLIPFIIIEFLRKNLPGLPTIKKVHYFNILNYVKSEKKDLYLLILYRLYLYDFSG